MASLEKISEHKLNRKVALGFATVIGVGFGIVNALWQPVDFTLDLSLLASTVGAVLATVVVHELLHALPAWVIGLRPEFGLKPPLVYITFKEKINARAFKVIALTPFVVLSAICIALYHYDVLRRGAYIALMINIIGSIGDLWIVTVLLGKGRTCMVQDTKTGIELYSPTDAPR